MKLNFNKVFEESLKYFKGDALPANVFATKYALTNKEGEFLESSPEDMHKRLAREFSRIESMYPNAMSEDEIYC